MSALANSIHSALVGDSEPLPLAADLRVGDCLKELKKLDKESVHLVVTDPPYFLDGLDNNWKKGNINKKNGVINGLPVGMKFDPRQGKELQAFINKVGEALMPALMPGAFAVFFSQPRLVHRMAVGLEDAGFEIRDLYAWHFKERAQFKAFTLDHFVDKKDISEQEKTEIKVCLDGRRTAQVRPQFEAMILAQKPKEGTFLENWLKYSTGLMNPRASLDGKKPSSVMLVEKPAKSEYNTHLTVKPVLLFRHLIELFSKKGQTVLDPFLGTGTTAVAAKQAERRCIGIEIEPKYVHIATKRIKEEK